MTKLRNRMTDDGDGRRGSRAVNLHKRAQAALHRTEGFVQGEPLAERAQAVGALRCVAEVYVSHVCRAPTESTGLGDSRRGSSAGCWP